jgi:hypothetical protein
MKQRMEPEIESGMNDKMNKTSLNRVQTGGAQGEAS